MIVAIRIAFKRCWKLLKFQNLFHQTCLPLHSYRLQVNLNFLISLHSNLRRNTFSSIQINMIWIVRLWVMRLEKVFRGIIFIGWDGGFYYKSWQIVKRFCLLSSSRCSFDLHASSKWCNDGFFYFYTQKELALFTRYI